MEIVLPVFGSSEFMGGGRGGGANLFAILDNQLPHIRKISCHISGRPAATYLVKTKLSPALISLGLAKRNLKEMFGYNRISLRRAYDAF